MALDSGEKNEAQIAAPAPVVDTLQAYRGGDATVNNAVFQTTSAGAEALLPQPILVADTPNNPNHIAGTYNPADIAYANQHFTKPEVAALEEVGPGNFNQMMEQAEHAPGAMSQNLLTAF